MPFVVKILARQQEARNRIERIGGFPVRIPFLATMFVRSRGDFISLFDHEKA
jgi:hypothetical protein